MRDLRLEPVFDVRGSFSLSERLLNIFYSYADARSCALSSDQQEMPQHLPRDSRSWGESGFPLRGMVHRVRPVDEMIDW